MTDSNGTKLEHGVASAHFSAPRHGWIHLRIDGLTAGDDYVRISEVYDPFGELIPFLEAMASDERPARWEIDEEGRYVQILFLPSIGSGASQLARAQMVLLRDGGGADALRSDVTITRCVVDPKYAALTLYAAFREMADSPARDPRHWEGMCGDYEDGESGPNWSLADIRSVTLDDMLEGKEPLT